MKTQQIPEHCALLEVHCLKYISGPILGKGMRAIFQKKGRKY